ncbi:MAG: hypothetical protein ACFFF4_01960 [Candidatus Thorarchaeota archaeon]
MSIDVKERLTHLVNEQDLSAIQLLASEVGLTEEETLEILRIALNEGLIDGYITEDNKRIFKHDVAVSDRPSIAGEETPPDFLSYNSAPGKAIAFIGFLVIIAALIILATSGGIIYYENLGTIFLLFGVVITLSGCYWVGRRKTP